MRRLSVALLAAACATTPAPRTDAPAAPVARWAPTPPPPPAATRPPRQFPEVTSWTLKNGLTVVVVEHHERPLVRLRLVFPSGSSSDSAAVAGATGFALALLGMSRDVTNSAGEIDYSEKALRRELIEKGAVFRSDVDLDGSWVGIDGMSKDARSLLEALAEAVKKPRQGESSFSGLLQAASDMVDERQLTDPDVLERAVVQRAFGDGEAGSPYGTAESLSRIGLDEVIKRQSELVHPSGATLMVFGDVRSVDVKAFITTTFGSWQGGEEPPVRAKPIRAKPVPRRTVTFLPRPGARSTLVCAARPLGDLKASDAVVRVVAEVLGRRLTQRLREKETMTYDVSTGLEYRQQNRALVLCTRFASPSTLAGLRTTLATLDKAPVPTPDEVEVARRQLISRVERSVTSLDGVTSAWLRSRVTGRAFKPQETLDGLAQVSPDELTAPWAAVTSPSPYQLVLLGDRGHVEPAVKALTLGALRTPTLGQVEQDSRTGDDD
ncbi:MAG: insulinase family protein [Myxococcaceae bacterium]|nr:insulinase family protein [Myxococcaceae bacterium]